MSELTRPRIVHVTTAHRADDVRIYERECRSLAAQGRYEVYIVGCGALPLGSDVSLIPLRQIPQARARRLIAGPTRAWVLATSLNADLWHFHDPELLPVALRLAMRGERVIWDAHEDYLGQFGEGDNKSWIPGFVRPVVRAGLHGALKGIDRRAAGIVSATSHIARCYENPLTVVVGNEARIEDFTACRPSSESQRVLFTGHVYPTNLFREVVEAVAAIPHIELAVAGRQPNVAEWTRASNLLNGRLVHLGWLDRPGLAQAMNESSVALATYAPIPTFMDPNAAPTKVYEFCAAGLPFVGSPVPSVQRLAHESGGGFICADYTSAAISAGIRKVLAGGPEWDEFSRSGRRWAEAHGGWSESERRLLALYRDILGV